MFFQDHAVLFALICALVAVPARSLPDAVAAPPAGRQRAHAGDRARRAGGRGGLPQEAVHGRRARRDRPVPAARPLRQARLGQRLRLPDRRRSLGGGGLHRHECGRPLERAHRGCGPGRPQAGVRRRVQGRLRHRPAGRRSRPARRRRLLPAADAGHGPLARLGHRRPRRARVRRLADLGVRATRRRDLHEGGGRRRRPGREDRGRHPRGRSEEPGSDRRQRRRQRRRLRRHGRRPLRDLRRHGGRGDAPRDAVPGQRDLPLPARHRRHVDPRVGDRHVLRQDRRGPERDHQRALQVRHRRHAALGGRLHPGHAGLRRRPVQLR